MSLTAQPARFTPPESETLADWTRHWAEIAPDRAAVIGVDGRTLLSYRELVARCEILARGLAGLGIQPGDVVAMQLPNTADFIALYIAAGMCRAIVQTIHMSYRRADIAPLLRHSGARVAIVESHNKGYRAVDELLLCTSGTTAQPKGVPATYRQFLSNARLSAGALGLDMESGLLSAAPFTHLYGLYSIHMTLYAGAGIVVLPSFVPVELAAALRLGRPTALFAAPAHLAACLAQGLLDRDAVSSLRFAMACGNIKAIKPRCVSLRGILSVNQVAPLSTTRNWATFCR
jgi:cyclohexanecarboxylate-CoA ligase